ncbi:hypothetical protein [Burkholderia ubonensis]|nr:hypothetical protein [Burkholderia ubonensis]
MKKTLFALVALAATGSAMAASTNPFSRDISEPVAVKSPYTFELGLTTHREVYKEYVASGKLMQEEAWMTGVKGGVTRELADIGGKVVLTGEFAMGRADYTGSYQGGNYGELHLGGLNRNLIEVTGMYKQSAPKWNGLTVGAGLGYRRLVDNLQDGGPGGYKRTNERLYLILGLEQAFQFKTWSITPGVQYKHILKSKQTSDLYGGVTVDQHRGYGAEVSIAFSHKSEKYNTVITPYYRQWNVKDSTVDARTNLYEPRNRTKELGIALTVQF